MDQNPHALAIIAALELDSLTVGDGVASQSGSAIVAPQVVLHMLPGGSVDGTAASPDEWVDGRFQLTAIGRVAAEARYYADRAADSLASNTLDVDTRSIQRVRPLEPWGQVLRDDDVSPPLFYATRTYGLWSFSDPTAS